MGVATQSKPEAEKPVENKPSSGFGGGFGGFGGMFGSKNETKKPEEPKKESTVKATNSVTPPAKPE